MKNVNYPKSYTAFLDGYKPGATSAVEVAVQVNALASEFVIINNELVSAERALSLVAETMESRVDESGKALSSTKAKVFTEATAEANDVNELKAHKENLRVLIAALDSLQRGITDALKVPGANGLI